MKHGLALVLFLLAVSLPAEAQSGTITLQGDQIFRISDPSTPVVRITITSSGTYITATQNLRIIISSKSHLEWDTSVTNLVISGDASYKVDSSVSYPDKKTLLINVLSGFSANQFIHFHGARMTQFSQISVGEPLRVDYTGDGLSDEETTNQIFVGGPPTLSSGVDQDFDLNDTVVEASPITITENSIVSRNIDPD